MLDELVGSYNYRFFNNSCLVLFWGKTLSSGWGISKTSSTHSILWSMLPPKNYPSLSSFFFVLPFFVLIFLQNKYYGICPGGRNLNRVAGPCACWYVCGNRFWTGSNWFGTGFGRHVYGDGVLLPGLSFGLSKTLATSSTSWLLVWNIFQIK